MEGDVCASICRPAYTCLRCVLCVYCLLLPVGRSDLSLSVSSDPLINSLHRSPLKLRLCLQNILRPFCI